MYPRLVRLNHLRLVLAASLAASALLLGACVPSESGSASEAGSGSDDAVLPPPPEFPETGQVPADLLIAGLVYDFTTTPTDLNLWVPPTEQAECAASKIVADLGAPTLSELGYLPGTSGASLNDIELTVAETIRIGTLFESCVDMTQATAALFMGSGNMTSAQALCMADGLAEQGLAGSFVDAWAFGTEVDPFNNDAEMATAMLAYANVCLPDTAFTWYGVDLPGDEEIQGVEGDDTGEAGEDLPGSAGRSEASEFEADEQN